jgi:outer membrane protein TolC
MEAMRIRTVGLRAAVLLGCVGLLAACGCVLPGEFDGRVVNRYQRAMSQRAPQPRGDAESMDVFVPSARMTLPPLNVIQGMPRRVELSLDQAVIYALAGNPEIGVASFDPAISREDVVQAAAAFDLIATAGFSYEKQDNRTDSAFGGGESKVKEFSVGLAQKLVTGAEWAADLSMTRTWDNSTFRTLSPRYEPILTMQVTQPLLRGGWPEVNLARLRVARLTHRQSLAEFRGTVEQIVTDVFTAYWQLIQARRDVEVQQDLLEATRRTLDQVRARRGVDAPVKTVIAQVEAALRAREAALLLARKLAGDAEEELARLVSHPEIGPVEDVEIVPTTDIPMRPVLLDRQDQLRTALRNSPLLEQARLAIAAADINVAVAENETLPRLDLTASTTLQGLGRTWHDSSDQLRSLEYIGYSVAVEMEYPLGNRAALAALRGARYQRRQAVAGMQNAADRISQRVNERIRAVRTAWQRVEVQQAAAEAARAQAEGLEQRLAIQQKTPEFLLVLLQAQETLAQARRNTWQAMTDYNVARLELAEVTGTVLQQPRVKIALPPAAGEGGWPALPDDEPETATAPARAD